MFFKTLAILILTISLFASCKKEDVPYDYQTLGLSANDLLSGHRYTSLDVHIQYMPGFAPTDSSTTALKSFLTQHLNKPNGINIYSQEIPSGGREILSLSDIVNIERNHRSSFSLGDKLTVNILVTDGKSNAPTTLATSYWNTSTCLFGKAITSRSGGSGQITTSQLYTTLLQHELGHLLGLINQGSSMQAPHEDQINKSHCINSMCLMYFDVETLTGNANFNRLLDTNCLLDLRANGGK